MLDAPLPDAPLPDVPGTTQITVGQKTVKSLHRSYWSCIWPVRVAHKSCHTPELGPSLEGR